MHKHFTLQYQVRENAAKRLLAAAKLPRYFAATKCENFHLRRSRETSPKNRLSPSLSSQQITPLRLPSPPITSNPLFSPLFSPPTPYFSLHHPLSLSHVFFNPYPPPFLLFLNHHPKLTPSTNSGEFSDHHNGIRANLEVLRGHLAHLTFL